MIVGVPVESHPHERRVSLVPAAVPTLAKAGLEVLVERGAGKNAGFPDAAYEEQGARLAQDRIQLFSSADVLLQVHGLGVNSDAGHADLELLRSGQVVLGLLNPLGVPDAARALAARGVTAFALELLEGIYMTPTYGNTLMGLACGKPFVPEDNYKITYYAPQPRAAIQPHDDDRRWHDHPGPVLCGRGRRGWASGHRHLAPPGRSGALLRCPASSQGAGAKSRRQVPGTKVGDGWN